MPSESSGRCALAVLYAMWVLIKLYVNTALLFGYALFCTRRGQGLLIAVGAAFALLALSTVKL